MLNEMLAQNRYRLIFLAVLCISIFIIMLSTNVIVPSTFEINPIAEPLRIGMNFVVSGLMALNLTVALFRHEVLGKIGGKSSLLGAVLGLFGNTCAICQPFWLVYLGFGSAFAFLSDWGLYISMLSAVLLILSLRGQLSKKCEVKIHGKNAKC